MNQVITMPKLSAEMKTGVLTAWSKQTGDIVKKGEVLYEVEVGAPVALICSQQ